MHRAMRFTFTACLCLMPIQAFAEDLSGVAITELIGGERVFLSTPFGVEMPLHYRTDGTVTGDVSGFSMARMFAPRETGRWWIDGDSLCQQWPTWYDGAVSCFELAVGEDGTISWRRDDGESGTARIDG